MNEIILPYGKRKEIKEELRVSYPTIIRALKGKNRSLVTQKIRQMAYVKGGYEVVRLKCDVK
ncbi:MAG: hypothetical protein CSA89_01470 [Bacteroidales bacterium]|nr:MAG: hypothetical protein CSA89_01470 [Bacteroidales bacterium]